MLQYHFQIYWNTYIPCSIAGAEFRRKDAIAASGETGFSRLAGKVVGDGLIFGKEHWPTLWYTYKKLLNMAIETIDLRLEMVICPWLC